MTTRHERGRPWSPDELQERVDSVLDAIEDARTHLLDQGVKAAQTKWRYERAKARALIAGVVGKNADERRARLISVQVEPGVTVADLGEAKDLAENMFDASKKLINLMDREAAILQTLVVSGRDNGTDPRSR